MFKRCFSLTVLLLSLALNGKGQRSYEISAYAEHKVNLFALGSEGAEWSVSGAGQLKGGYGLNFLTSKNNKFKIGFGVSYNMDFFSAGSLKYFYGYLRSASFKNYKISGIFSMQFKHRFYLSGYTDICYFTYQYFNGVPDREHQSGPGSYENNKPNIYALGLSVRFGKQFKLFKHNYLGLHVGIQTPYLFLNWEPVHYKGVNICGMVLGVNYAFKWGVQESKVMKE